MASPVRVLLPIAAGVALLLGSCGDGGGTDATGDGLEHVHGLGVNPADGALYIATHTGVFRSPQSSESVERVGEGRQDTMGFTVAGPDRFLASGHPASGESGPPNLGLISSADAGRSWQEVSLGGEADFHVLRFTDGRLYGYDATGGRLMLSEDGGATWSERQPPAQVIDLAADPDDPARILASTGSGLMVSEDDGRSWRPVEGGDRLGLLAWPQRDRLYLADAAGNVHASSDAGRRWEEVGSIGGQPAAMIAESGRELLAALADGTILRSTDGGASWGVRVQP